MTWQKHTLGVSHLLRKNSIVVAVAYSLPGASLGNHEGSGRTDSIRHANQSTEGIVAVCL